MQKMLLLALLFSGAASAQHYVIVNPPEKVKPVTKNIYTAKTDPNNPTPQDQFLAYQKALIDKIHDKIKLANEDIGRACTLQISLNSHTRTVSSINVLNCTMGERFQKQVPDAVVQAVAETPVPNNIAVRAMANMLTFKFEPRFGSKKPPSFSKTYTTK